MSDLISEHLLEMNRQLHEQVESFGANSAKWASQVRDLCKMVGTIDVLDYGCGKGELAKACEDLNVLNYDPAVREYAANNEPRDVLICTDVLEHVEPDKVDAVLADMARCMLRAAMVVIDVQPAVKHYPDGQNTHLTVRHPRWWLNKVMEHFDISQAQVLQPEIRLILRPHSKDYDGSPTDDRAAPGDPESEQPDAGESPLGTPV